MPAPWLGISEIQDFRTLDVNFAGNASAAETYFQM